MTWSWFDLAWPWIGSIAAVLLLILLFGTDKLRSDLSLSRWRDRIWLSWLAVPVYMLHNIEEYGIDLLGRIHEFPDALCTNLGLGAYPACPVPPSFYLAVNISLFWVAAPAAALLSRRYPLVGLTLYGVIFINGLIHLVPILLGRGYDPGVLTGVILFLPVSIWVARTCFGPNRIRVRGLALIVGVGVVGHAMLLSSVFSFIAGRIDSLALVSVQILNAGLLLLIPFVGERLLHINYKPSVGARD